MEGMVSPRSFPDRDAARANRDLSGYDFFSARAGARAGGALRSGCCGEGGGRSRGCVIERVRAKIGAGLPPAELLPRRQLLDTRPNMWAFVACMFRKIPEQVYEGFRLDRRGIDRSLVHAQGWEALEEGPGGGCELLAAVPDPDCPGIAIVLVTLFDVAEDGSSYSASMEMVDWVPVEG